jgi:hypothetical protein
MVAVGAAVWGWCHTRGLARNKTHTSQMRTKPCDGHKREATLANPMGGSDKINFSNPCRNRRNRAGRDFPANASANSAATETPAGNDNANSSGGM